MNRKWVSMLLSVALVVGLFAMMPAPRAMAASGTLDFGNTADGTTATTGNTGFGGVRIGSGGGSFTIKNTGQEIGTQAELQGIAPTSTSVNSVGVTSTEYGTAATVFTIAFEVYFSGGSSGKWYFFAGNGATFGSAQTQQFNSSEVFTGLQFVYGASNTITTNYLSGSNWVSTGLSGTPFAQNAPYTVSIIGNNSASTIYYGTEDVPAYKFDLWVNGTLAGDDLAKGSLADETNINAFRFYGINSTGNVAAINLDNIRWWNQIVPPSMSTYSTVSSVPALTYSVLNMNSGNASLAGAVTVNELLSLNTGNLTLGTSDLTLGTDATVSGTPSASNMVITDSTGKLCKTFGAAGSFTFPIGDNTGTAEYSPVALTVNSGSGMGDFCFRVTDAAPTHKPTGVSNYITRDWVGSTTASGPNYNATFTYLPADVVGTEANMSGKRYGSTLPWQTLGAVDTGNHQFTGSNLTEMSEFTAFDTALAVPLASLDAVPAPGRVTVTWETATEVDILGFHLYRAPAGATDGGWTRLNPVMIPSQAPGSPSGYSYRYDDATTARGATYRYRLTAVGMDGVETSLDSVQVSTPYWLWMSAVGR